MDEMDMFDAPIPGENYTSDTKNYPWHRPPEYTDIDKAIGHALQDLTDEEENVIQYMTMIDMGMTIATATDTYLTIGIANGKWTPDFAILMAGPVSRMLEIMAKTYNIDFDLGIEEPSTQVTSVFLKALRDGDITVNDSAVDVAEGMGAEVTPPSTGLMGLGAPVGEAAAEDEQLAMLGYGNEQEPMTDEEVQQ